jgi:hypothetical protein
MWKHERATRVHAPTIIPRQLNSVTCLIIETLLIL